MQFPVKNVRVPRSVGGQSFMALALTVFAQCSFVMDTQTDIVVATVVETPVFRLKTAAGTTYHATSPPIGACL